MNSRLPDPTMPTAEVRHADEIVQAKTLYGELVQSERRDLKRAYDLGKLLLSIKEHGQHGDMAKTGVPRQRAAEMMRLAKCPAPDIWAFESIRQALESVKPSQQSDNSDDASSNGQSEGSDGEESDEESEGLDPEEYCARCIRIGTPVKDCKACAALREKADPEDDKEEEALKDDGEREVPDCLLPVFQSVAAFKLAARRAATAATALEQVEATAAHAHLERVGQALSPKRGRTVDSTFFKTAAVRLNRNCPSLVCPKCEGQEASQDNEPCTRCDGKGWLAKQEVKE